MEPKKKSVSDYIIPVLLFIAALYIASVTAVSYDYVKQYPEISSTGDEKFNLSMFLNDLTVRLEAGEISYSKSTIKFLLVTVAAGALTAGYFMTSQKKLITGKEYGTAEWGSAAQVAYLSAKGCLKEAVKKINKNKKLSKTEKKEAIRKAEEKYRYSDIKLTKTESLCLYHTDSLNCNTLVMAGSGAGKTTGYAMPNILQAADSEYSPCMVITDPKGEILQRTGYFLKEIAGYQVKVLNLKDQKQSFRYNPFRYINIRNDVGELENQVKKLTTAIMEYSADPESKKGEAFWTEMSIALAESLFLAVFYALPEEERNMNGVIWMFSMLKIDEEQDNEDSDLDYFFQEYADHFADDNNALSAYRKYVEFRRKCRGRTANSVLATMKSKLGAFDNKNIQRIVSGDDMDLELLGEERVAIFIVLPPMEKAFNFIANLLYVQMFDIIEYTATVKHDQKLPIPVRFILDEFYNTGRIPSFDSILSYARSFGVSISIIIQSLDQLKSMYEKTWGTIIDNCSTFLYLGGVGHPENLKYISEKLGKGTFDKRNYSHSKGKQSSSSTTDDKIGRELMTADEVGKIHPRKCILFINGKNPYYSEKNYFVYHPNYKYTWDADKEHNVFLVEIPENNIEGHQTETPMPEAGTPAVMIDKIPEPQFEEDIEKIVEDVTLELSDYIVVPDDEIMLPEEIPEMDKYRELSDEELDKVITAEIDAEDEELREQINDQLEDFGAFDEMLNAME